MGSLTRWARCREPTFVLKFLNPTCEEFKTYNTYKEVLNMQIQHSVSTFNSATSSALISNISTNKTTVAFKEANTYRHVVLTSREEVRRFVAELVKAS